LDLGPLDLLAPGSWLMALALLPVVLLVVLLLAPGSWLLAAPGSLLALALSQSQHWQTSWHSWTWALGATGHWALALALGAGPGPKQPETRFETRNPKPKPRAGVRPRGAWTVDAASWVVGVVVVGGSGSGSEITRI
jgi:hypothetical protein